MRGSRGLLATLALTLSVSEFADIVRLDVRPGVKLPVHYVKRDGATATLILIPGGVGGFGKPELGEPTSPNFLVRSREYFANAGFNVAIMGRPQDQPDLTYAVRIGADHLADIQKLVDFVKADTGLPVWLVGTSRGSVSAAAAAIAFSADTLAGVVLTASVVRDKPGALPDQKLANIRVPVLLVHHMQDACPICRPADLPHVLSALTGAPVKKLLMLDGGGPPQGGACEALHFHGFIGMEREAAKAITDWIAKPAS
jgi:flavin-binding protein dodecin